ncbi:MAG: hypothetical protein IH851_01535 [Armatimonadetes bacterium]|nr:hypothetical protein [Armatimonadota bacterium]
MGALALAGAPKSVELTVYNANFALVKEVRSFNLRAGRQEVRVEDVASYIDPTSVSFKSLTPGSSIDILEQNYQYDLLSTQSILLKSIGKRVRLRQQLQNGDVVVTEGILLSAPGQVVSTGAGASRVYTGMVVETDDGRYVLNPTGTVEVLEIPEGLISKPTLMWNLLAGRSGAYDIELAYLTNQIGWSADYVLTLNEDDTMADLNGWVTINNKSGATYENASLKLIAGDVRRVQPRARGGFGGGRLEMAAAADLGFAEETLFEYHLYTLQRPATVRNNETKQISLLSASDVAVEKELIFEGQRSMWRSRGVSYRPGQGYATDLNVKINVIIVLRNSKENNLGIPLPKGKVRVYKRDSAGQVQMLGEDQIDHTSREEKLRLWIGNAFDVVGERKRLSFRKISNTVVQEAFEIKVRNRKTKSVAVRVIEHGWGDWEILSETMPGKKLDSNTFEYAITLQPDEEKVITYTIQTRW